MFLIAEEFEVGFRHVMVALTMILKAVGLEPRGRLQALLARGAWAFLSARNRHLERIAA